MNQDQTFAQDDNVSFRQSPRKRRRINYQEPSILDMEQYLAETTEAAPSLSRSATGSELQVEDTAHLAGRGNSQNVTSVEINRRRSLSHAKGSSGRSTDLRTSSSVLKSNQSPMLDVASPNVAKGALDNPQKSDRSMSVKPKLAYVLIRKYKQESNVIFLKSIDGRSLNLASVCATIVDHTSDNHFQEIIFRLSSDSNLKQTAKLDREDEESFVHMRMVFRGAINDHFKNHGVVQYTMEWEPVFEENTESGPHPAEDSPDDFDLL